MKSLSKEQTMLWKKIMICVFTGFSSGLPLFFILNLIPVWLRTEGIDLKSIGLLALIQLPYTLKFLWSPFLDAYTLSIFGRRKSWMLLAQILLLCILAAFSLFEPQKDYQSIVVLCFLLTLFSATQDIVIDAFRREILTDSELGLGNSIAVNVYRLAALVPGSLALVLSESMTWSSVFLITALFMLPGILTTLIVKEPKLTGEVYNKTFDDIVVAPFKEFFQRQGIKQALLILSFILLYKIGDSMAVALASPFYLDMGYSAMDIGIIAKNAGLWPAIIFGILGGIWMLKIGINRALWLFGLVQIVTILGYVWLSSFGHFDVITFQEQIWLALVIGAEYAGVGLGTAAFVAYIARETNPLYTATQLALLTSISAVPRTFINSSAGYLIDWLGYTHFFWFCFFIAIPGLLLLPKVAPWHDKISK